MDNTKAPRHKLHHSISQQPLYPPSRQMQKNCLSIDYQGPFPTQEAARKQQSDLTTAFQTTHQHLSAHEIKEHHGTFHRIAYAGLLTELQSHIEEIEV